MSIPSHSNIIKAPTTLTYSCMLYVFVSCVRCVWIIRSYVVCAWGKVCRHKFPALSSCSVYKWVVGCDSLRNFRLLWSHFLRCPHPNQHLLTMQASSRWLQTEVFHFQWTHQYTAPSTFFACTSVHVLYRVVVFPLCVFVCPMKMCVLLTKCIHKLVDFADCAIR